MFNPLKIIRSSLTGKLISVTVILIIVAVGISWYLLINTFKRRGINDAIRYTMSYTDLIVRSTRYSMLMRQRDAIQETIEEIARKENIEKIRIMDTDGRIHFSSIPEEIGQTVDRDSFVCKGCLVTDEEISGKDKKWFIYTGNDGNRTLVSIMPILNEPSCYTAVCHVHPENQKILGVLRTDYSLSSVDRDIRILIMKTAIYAVVLIIGGSFILYLILRRFVLKPVSVLSTAMKRVRSGDFNHTVEISSQDEMGVLGNIFNMMTKELKDARERTEDWTFKLEEEVAKKTEELKRSQYRLIEAEKLASLGRLTSDIAHEIRNPLTAVGGFARRLYRIVNSPREKEYVGIIVEEVARLEKILKDVLTFSRSAGYNLERQNIKEVVKETVRVYEHLCMDHNIDIEVMIDEDIPPVLIARDQLRQAISNLITNAIDAMPKGGALTVTAEAESLHGVTYVVIRITDTGEGIPEDKLSVIFEPFYSTKEPGVGTGLGLPITRKIMQEHGGFIDVKSTVGKGTCMSLYLPYQSTKESQKMKCWEYMRCGRDENTGQRCPAYPDFGRICWVIAGTFCKGQIHGTFAQKYEDCSKCEFYKKVRNKEL